MICKWKRGAIVQKGEDDAKWKGKNAKFGRGLVDVICWFQALHMRVGRWLFWEHVLGVDRRPLWSFLQILTPNWVGIIMMLANFRASILLRWDIDSASSTLKSCIAPQSFFDAIETFYHVRLRVLLVCCNNLRNYSDTEGHVFEEYLILPFSIASLTTLWR